MNVCEKIKARRVELKLRDVEVAQQVGLSIDEYCDVEQHADEIFEITEIRQVKKICEVLGFDFLDLFDMRCAFCEEGRKWHKDYFLPRNELIRKKRIEMGLSTNEFGDKVNYYEEIINNIETDPNYLETWTIDNNIKGISNVLEIPVQILLGIKCSKCGR